jgi:dihydroxyacid dehydratase/phosphogluconate dehydratase
VKLTIDDFTRIGKRVPVLADLKPSGKHHDVANSSPSAASVRS